MFSNKRKGNPKWLKYYYTLNYLLSKKITCNQNLKLFAENILIQEKNTMDFIDLLRISPEIFENNIYLSKYKDFTLYDHQKELFTLCKSKNPKFIQYVAPTGTGKTLSPLGLSEGHRIIFVCAARHVGLSLAKSAISCKKKVAFAFGCTCSEDVRLHYYSAKEYSINKRTGGIGKVDNTVGDNVEIMICDIKSYLHAMHYMMAFNSVNDIILYWDEPTITMDYQDHEYHEIIHSNWKNTYS